jgi:cytochrome c oxidase assembly protein subunit 15
MLMLYRLSITEWKPVTGSLPPLSASDWQSEFDKYRASPEFKLLNPHMNIEEFKKIYYMEWGHRLWGRVVGLSFVIPAVYFVAKRKVSANMVLRLLGISGLIGFQGALGWWMVKSGLKDDLFAPGSHPRVSQYRLTAHLGAAFVCYTAMLWNGLSILRDAKLLSFPPRGLEKLQHLSVPELSIFRKSVAGLALLVFTTAMSGGLVAGLDAGLIYNQFPRMGEGFAPPRSELFSKFYSRKEDGSDIWWRNMLENPSTVQLNHRILATTTFTAILSLWAYSRFNKKVRAALPNAGRKGMLGVVHLVFLQVVLGISTLIYLVPVPLAAAHQAGSLALLTGTLVLGSRVWVPKRSMQLLQSKLKFAASQSFPTQRFGVQNTATKSDPKGLHVKYVPSEEWRRLDKVRKSLP